MNKVGGVVVSHGQLANELLSAAETVVGPVEHMQAVSIGWHDDVEMARDEIERAIKQVDKGSGVIMLTDMFGGTPTNISAMFLKPDEVEIVT
jgi:PTS system mannose-specific IIA component